MLFLDVRSGPSFEVFIRMSCLDVRVGATSSRPRRGAGGRVVAALREGIAG
jgi:hypothetical protein